MKREQEKVAQDKAAKVAQEKAAQEARDKQAKEDAARKQKEALAAKQKAQLDAETQREAAQEAARMEAERTGVMADYILQIQDKIARNWNQPLSAQAWARMQDQRGAVAERRRRRREGRQCSLQRRRRGEAIDRSGRTESVTVAEAAVAGGVRAELDRDVQARRSVGHERITARRARTNEE